MTTDKLALYNIALGSIGERRLASLTEDGESRRMLDEIWSRGGGLIKMALEQGYWNFAIRTVKMEASASVDPAFGYNYAFDIPSDFIRLVQISSGEFFHDPLNRYEIEGAYFYAGIDPIYIRFVSDGEDWGSDLSKWPDSFTQWAGHWMGLQMAPRLKNDIDMAAIRKEVNRLLVEARSRDAMQEPTRFVPVGSWVRSREGRFNSGRRDRGSRSSLIG